MKLSFLSKIAVVVALGLLGSRFAQAQSRVDLWSAAGGAWTMANQPGFTEGVGGTLNPNATSDSGADLNVAGATSGFYTDYYYTFSSTPAFTLVTSNVLADINVVTFSFVSNRSFSSGAASLNFNGVQAVDSFSSVAAGSISGFAVTRYTWTWDVSELGNASSFSIGWTTPAAAHTVYDEVSLIQAVPEPHEYALGMAAMLGVVIWMRRRRAAVVG